MCQKQIREPHSHRLIGNASLLDKSSPFVSVVYLLRSVENLAFGHLSGSRELECGSFIHAQTGRKRRHQFHGLLSFEYSQDFAKAQSRSAVRGETSSTTATS